MWCVVTYASTENKLPGVFRSAWAFFIILYIFAFAVSNFMFCLIYIFTNEISFDVMYQEKRTWLEPISSSHIQAKRNK